jgi:uncharacterized OsmC-like protein
MGQYEQINGVDVNRLFDTIGAIDGEPGLAKFCFRNRNRWLNGGHNRSTINTFYGAGQEHNDRKTTFVLDNDEPDVLLGTDQGASPPEQLLHALAGCLTTSLVYWAAAKGIRLDEVETHIEGDLDLRGFLGMDENIRNGFERIRVSFKVNGDATETQLAELVDLAQKRSVIFDTLTNGVNVAVDIVPEELPLEV